MKLSFSTLGCPDWTIEQVAKNGAALGFDGVELRIGGDRHIDPSLPQSRRNELRGMFSDCGLSVVCASGYTQFTGSDAALLKSNGEQLLKNAELAASLGSPYVRTFMGDGVFGEAGADALAIYCEKAADLGVTVILETHDSFCTGRQTAEIMAAVKCGSLQILWDIHHSILAGETPSDTVRILGDSIRHVHIKDAGHEHQAVHVGTGILPIADAVGVLQAAGFDGYYSFEWEKMWIRTLDDPEIALPKYVSFMRSL